MRIYKKISFLIIIALFGLSFISIGYSYEDTEYLANVLDNTYYGVEMNIGDNLTWSFETYSEEFEVQCRIDSDIYLSEGLTSDSGVWYAPDSDTYFIIFINFDTLLFRSGFIDIYFEVNVEPTPPPDPDSNPNELSILSFNPLIIIGIIGCISSLSVVIIKRRIRKL